MPTLAPTWAATAFATGVATGTEIEAAAPDTSELSNPAEHDAENARASALRPDDDDDDDDGNIGRNTGRTPARGGGTPHTGGRQAAFGGRRFCVFLVLFRGLATWRCGSHTFRRVLKAAVDDGAQQFGLQQEVSEVGRVDANVVAPGKEAAMHRETDW